MDDLIQEFLTETTENLAQLDVDIVALEKDNNNTDLLSNIFRTIHTIKGTCGFIGLPRLEKVAHAGENVLGKFRDGELEVTPGAITVILECIDRIKDILTAIEETGSEPEGDDSALIAELDAYFKGEAPTENAGTESASPSPQETEEPLDTTNDGDDTQTPPPETELEETQNTPPQEDLPQGEATSQEEAIVSNEETETLESFQEADTKETTEAPQEDQIKQVAPKETKTEPEATKTPKASPPP